MAAEDRTTYQQFIEAEVAHAGVATALADAAVRHRRMEEAFNARILATCPDGGTLHFPYMQLTPPQYWQRNFFSILFLSVFDALGIAEQRQHGYGMLLHGIRGIVTATDNIIDDEAKGSVLVQMRGGRVIPNVLLLLTESGIAHEAIAELCDGRDAVHATWRALIHALHALGEEESAEEGAIEEVLSPEALLDEVHRLRGGGLLQLALIAPELNEPALRENVLIAKDGINQIGLSQQIIDDLTDFEEDLCHRNHNLLRSWIVFNHPDGPCTDADLKALPREVLKAPELHFPQASAEVMQLAIELAVAGFERLHEVGHPVERPAALKLIQAMLKLRGLQRLWDLYERGERGELTPCAAETPNYTETLPGL